MFSVTLLKIHSTQHCSVEYRITVIQTNKSLIHFDVMQGRAVMSENTLGNFCLEALNEAQSGL